MDTQTLSSALKILEVLGPEGLFALVLAPGTLFSLVVLILYYVGERRSTRALEAYRADMADALKQYAAHQAETRQMYENNAELVRNWNRIADALQTVVVTNTEAMTRVVGAVDSNKFCPLLHKDQMHRLFSQTGDKS